MTFGANTNLNQLETLLIATNEKLDTIIEILGTPPPTTTYTIDDLYQILSDIHLDTMSMDGKLLTIRDLLSGPETYESGDTHDNLGWNVYRIRKGIVSDDFPPDSALPDLQSQTYQLFNIFDSHLVQTKVYLAQIQQILTYAFPNLGVSIAGFSQVYSGYIETVRNSILALKGSVGVPANALNIGPIGSRDVIQLLSLLGQLSTSQVGSGIAPSDVCEDAYISGGMALVPTVFEAWPPTIWAVWPDPPPAAIEFGTVFGVGVDFTELSPIAGNWDDWQIFVASDAANWGAYVGGDVEQSLVRYPSNVWVDLTGYTYNLSVFVGGSNSVRAYLCQGWGAGSGGGGPWGGGSGSGGPWGGGCISAASDVVTVTYPPGTSPASHTRYYMPLSGAGLVTTNSVTVGSSTFFYSVSDAVTTTDMFATRITLLAGTLARIFWVTSAGTGLVHVLDTIGEAHVIPDHTIYLSIDNYQSNEISPGPTFSVELCPEGSY